MNCGLCACRLSCLWVCIRTGSWGSTLALSYAQKHLSAVKAVICFGIFTGCKSELDYFYKSYVTDTVCAACCSSAPDCCCVCSGLNEHFPEEWELFCAPIPAVERVDLLGAYYRRLICGKELCTTSRCRVCRSHLDDDTASPFLGVRARWAHGAAAAGTGAHLAAIRRCA